MSDKSSYYKMLDNINRLSNITMILVDNMEDTKIISDKILNYLNTKVIDINFNVKQHIRSNNISNILDDKSIIKNDPKHFVLYYDRSKNGNYLRSSNDYTIFLNIFKDIRNLNEKLIFITDNNWIKIMQIADIVLSLLPDYKMEIHKSRFLVGSNLIDLKTN